jgi:NADH pyrophosphatase NudC (nudix superfamily)
VEDGEMPADTVVREMAEELDVAVRPIRSVWQCPTEDGAYDLEWWLAEIVDGEPRCAEPEVVDLRWVSPEEIHALSPTFSDDVRFIDEVWPTL